MAKKAFVTGGTGFIGSHLVEALRRRGYGEVRCLVRADMNWLDGQDVVPVPGDLGDLAALAEGVRGVEHVYHIAGVTRTPDWATYEATNVAGTLNLLRVLRQVNPAVEKVLVTSSLAAVGASENGVADEETPLNPISAYGRSKAVMERALAQPDDDGTVYLRDLPVVVVRPPAVYGPREADIFTFFKTVKTGLCPMIGSGKEPELSLVHARDLVEGMIDAVEAEATTGQTYFLGSEAFYSWREIKEATTAALGRKALTLPVPVAFVGVLGAVVEAASKLTGRYPPLNRDKAREILQACKKCSVEKAQRHFGYRQKIPLDDGVRETIAWYKEQGWL